MAEDEEEDWVFPLLDDEEDEDEDEDDVDQSSPLSWLNARLVFTAEGEAVYVPVHPFPRQKPRGSFEGFTKARQSLPTSPPGVVDAATLKPFVHSMTAVTIDKDMVEGLSSRASVAGHRFTHMFPQELKGKAKMEESPSASGRKRTCSVNPAPEVLLPRPASPAPEVQLFSQAKTHPVSGAPGVDTMRSKKAR